jgi:hypothetical protein
MNEFTHLVKAKKNNELLTMVYQFDTWSPEMLTAVQEELSHRGILPSDIKTRQEKIEEAEEKVLAEGKDGSALVFLLGWLTVIGLFGLAIGYNYGYATVTSKISGKRFYKYNTSTRKDGRILMNTSIILFALVILYKILNA